MAVANIIDKRENKYNVHVGLCIIEPSSNDNAIDGATFFDPSDSTVFCYHERYNQTINQLIIEFQEIDDNVTLFLYDGE